MSIFVVIENVTKSVNINKSPITYNDLVNIVADKFSLILDNMCILNKDGMLPELIYDQDKVNVYFRKVNMQYKYIFKLSENNLNIVIHLLSHLSKLDVMFLSTLCQYPEEICDRMKSYLNSNLEIDIKSSLFREIKKSAIRK